MTRRPTAVTCWREVRLSRLQSIGGSLRLPLLQNGACDFRLTPLLSILMLVTQTWREIVEFIPLSFWYDAPLISRYSDRRHDPWQVYGSPSCSPARWSFWISRACPSTSFSSWSR